MPASLVILYSDDCQPHLVAYSSLMANGYSWNHARDRGTYHLPGPEHLGWWAAVALILSVLLHIGVFIALERMKVSLRFQQAEELRTGSVNVQQVVEMRPEDMAISQTPEKVIEPPKQTADLLDEVDLLAALPENQEIDIDTNVDQASFALQMQTPNIKGEPKEVAMESVAEMSLDEAMPELGRELTDLKPAAVGQVIIDPGSRMVDDDLGSFTDQLLEQGANGKVDKGVLDGVATLDDLLILPPDILLSKKTLLPSDLLFEFNKAELREGAKVGLMKLALLMDRNPKLFCWIEGHTDLIGGEEFNRKLSLERAEAVKSYLVGSMRMEEARIITRGLGKSEPLVNSGTEEEQAPNRRVEIKMRKTKPEADAPAAVIEAPRAEVVPPAVEEPEAPKAVLIQPERAVPVEEPEIDAPRATPIEEPAPPVLVVPRAEPVEP